VTDTYTDGEPGLRGKPTGGLVVGRQLVARPKANDIYRIKLAMTFYKPADLSADASTVFNELWGHCIALGDAIAYLVRLGNEEKAARLLGRADVPGTYKYYLSKVVGTQERQETARRVYREF